MSAGAVTLTDCVFWLILYPFLTAKDYDLDFVSKNLITTLPSLLTLSRLHFNALVENMFFSIEYRYDIYDIIWKVIKPRHLVLLHHLAEANTEAAKWVVFFQKRHSGILSVTSFFFFLFFSGLKAVNPFPFNYIILFHQFSKSGLHTGRGLSVSSFMQMSQPSEFFFSSVFCFAYGNTTWVVFLLLIINPLHLMNVFTFQLQLIISMHSINAVLLLGETILNSLVSLVP